MQKVWLYLENGTFLEANSFGASTTNVGEIVFNSIAEVWIPHPMQAVGLGGHVSEDEVLVPGSEGHGAAFG